MSTEVKDTFCVLPFVQTVVRTNGSLNPCCTMHNTTNIRDIDIQQYWNSSEIKQLQNDMLESRFVEKCATCYNQERITGKSMRTDSLRDYKFFDPRYYKKIIDHRGYLDHQFPSRVEMHLGNLCNLKCLTCNPRDSSSFLTENHVLKISDHQQKNYQLDDSVIQHNFELILKNKVEILDLRGGESMMMPLVKQLLDQLPSNHSIETLRIQTNGTILDSVWKDIFKKFPKVEIMVSVDAYGSANEYIRYPSQWSVIEENVDYFLTMPHAQVYLNCTVSNLNFLILDQLIDWARKKQIYFHYHAVTEPKYYQYNNLPESLFESAKQKLSAYPEVAGLLNHNSDEKYWTEFCDMINLRDRHRKNSIFDTLPELKQHWKNL